MEAEVMVQGPKKKKPELTFRQFKRAIAQKARQNNPADAAFQYLKTKKNFLTHCSRSEIIALATLRTKKNYYVYVALLEFLKSQNLSSQARESLTPSVGVVAISLFEKQKLARAPEQFPNIILFSGVKALYADYDKLGFFARRRFNRKHSELFSLVFERLSELLLPTEVPQKKAIQLTCCQTLNLLPPERIAAFFAQHENIIPVVEENIRGREEFSNIQIAFAINKTKQKDHRLSKALENKNFSAFSDRVNDGATVTDDLVALIEQLVYLIENRFFNRRYKYMLEHCLAKLVRQHDSIKKALPLPKPFVERCLKIIDSYFWTSDKRKVLGFMTHKSDFSLLSLIRRKVRDFTKFVTLHKFTTEEVGQSLDAAVKAGRVDIEQRLLNTAGERAHFNQEEAEALVDVYGASLQATDSIGRNFLDIALERMGKIGTHIHEECVSEHPFADMFNFYVERMAEKDKAPQALLQKMIEIAVRRNISMQEFKGCLWVMDMLVRNNKIRFPDVFCVQLMREAFKDNRDYFHEFFIKRGWENFTQSKLAEGHEAARLRLLNTATNKLPPQEQAEKAKLKDEERKAKEEASRETASAPQLRVTPAHENVGANPPQREMHSEAELAAAQRKRDGMLDSSRGAEQPRQQPNEGQAERPSTGM